MLVYMFLAAWCYVGTKSWWIRPSTCWKPWRQEKPRQIAKNEWIGGNNVNIIYNIYIYVIIYIYRYIRALSHKITGQVVLENSGAMGGPL